MGMGNGTGISPAYWQAKNTSTNVALVSAISRHPVAPHDEPQAEQATCAHQGAPFQHAVLERTDQLTASVIEVHAGLTGGGIIQCFYQTFKVCVTHGYGMI